MLLANSENPEPMHFFDPLGDSRWEPFVQRHPQASVFHTSNWLEALRRTYGYKALALSTSPPGSAISNAWVFCSVDSWITGRRWVSLPFSDHCQPLIEDINQEVQYPSALKLLASQGRIRYLEIRPLAIPERVLARLPPPGLLASTKGYCFHRIDLTPDLEVLFRNCHKDSTQRKIERAHRERLRYEEGRSARLLDEFMALQAITRRRFGLPSQPKSWFRNVIACLGEASKIRVAYKGETPIAAILTLRHNQNIVYKYGCSDAAYHKLGGMHLLLWRTIEEGKRDGLRTFDLGRSDHASQGLITFKDRWGSQRSELSYQRFTSTKFPKDVYVQGGQGLKSSLLLNLLGRMPEVVGRAVGDRLYRHIG